MAKACEKQIFNMNKKIKVIILMGGKSSEHEISVLSGQSVTAALDEKKYDILPVVVSKDGKRWQLTDKKTILSLPDPIRLKGTSREITLGEKRKLEGTNPFSTTGADVVFIAMHGSFGEDGTIQGMLELAGIPYTGSNVLASAIGMDKEMFRKVMTTEKILIPKYTVVTSDKELVGLNEKIGKLPYFVKPNNQGSSVGSAIARTRKELRLAVKNALRYSENVLIDKYIKGTELTCGILGNRDPEALPVVEIVPKGEFFDYDSKYTESGTVEIVPARISKKIERKVKEAAKKVYKAVGASGFGRVDFILKDGKIYVLEINTIPGLTPLSLLPKEAKAAGISYPKMLERIINYAFQ